LLAYCRAGRLKKNNATVFVSEYQGNMVEVGSGKEALDLATDGTTLEKYQIP
jgi:hypothetical protein